jgi:hypothetical protein
VTPGFIGEVGVYANPHTIFFTICISTQLLNYASINVNKIYLGLMKKWPSGEILIECFEASILGLLMSSLVRVASSLIPSLWEGLKPLGAI